MIDLYQVSNIDFKLINEKIEKLSEEKYSIENEIDDLSEQESKIDINEVKKLLITIPDILDNGNFEQIKSIVHSLIESIVIYEDAIKITWKFQ